MTRGFLSILALSDITFIFFPALTILHYDFSPRDTSSIPNLIKRYYNFSRPRFDSVEKTSGRIQPPSNQQGRCHMVDDSNTTSDQENISKTPPGTDPIKDEIEESEVTIAMLTGEILRAERSIGFYLY